MGSLFFMNISVLISCKGNRKLFVLIISAFLGLLYLLPYKACATTASPAPVVYIQPDGTTLTIMLKGDEFIHWATTPDGFTILSDTLGYYEYASVDTDGKLGFSGIRVHDAMNRTTVEKRFLRKIKHGLFFSDLQVKEMKQWQQSGYQRSSSMSLSNGFPKTGTRKLLQILANFSNTTSTYSTGDFNAMMNTPGYNGTGSFRDYFLEVSYGQLTVNTTVTIWVNVPQTHDYYGPRDKWREFAYDAVVAAHTQTTVNFSDFDNNNDGIVDGVAIIHQGRGQEESANLNDIWAHKWDLSSAGYTISQCTFNGVRVDEYMTSPELFGPVSITNVGVVCHEFGHILGSPDFYDTDFAYAGLYDGTGKWDLMGDGNWNGTVGNYGNLPAHMNAWIKSYFHWTNPILITTQQTQILRNAQQYPDVIRYNGPVPIRYFLCENRQQTGFDTGLPGHGMIIYAIDSNNLCYRFNTNTINHDDIQAVCPMSAISTTANGVMLSPSNINTDGCPWPGSGLKTTFSDVTIPSSLYYLRNTAKPLLNIDENTLTKEISFCFLSCSPEGLGGFSATPNGTDKIDLTWINNIANDPVLLAYSYYPFIETPVPGISYSSGDILSYYSHVIFNGSGTSFQHTGLNANTTYYYSAWSVLPGNNYSYTLIATAIINTTLPPCPGLPSMTVNHYVTGGVAPEDKTVLYSTVTNIPGELGKCWITSNLGASHQADSIDDSTEASAGWYWQFNHKQGYKHDGITRIPGTEWLSSILTNDDWDLANDPCSLELGSHWHIPTFSEWNNAYNYGNWRYGYDHWNSGLKLHFAGYLYDRTVLNYVGGELCNRGLVGLIWSKSNLGINFYGGWTLYLYVYSSEMSNGSYSNGQTLRCIRESPTLPAITTTAVTNIAGFTVNTGGNITNDGGLPVTVRGVCWSLLPNPTIADSHTTDGSGTGTFISYISGLSPLTQYYVRAYATNNLGTAYGNELSFTTTWGCGLPLTINHLTTGGVAPANKTTTYGTVTNIPGEPSKCWITSNLGADHQATSVDDAAEASAGWYWQFNRKQGYKHDGVTRTPNTTWITNINENLDWEAINDPCALELSADWRIPTYTEWFNVDAAGNWTDWNGPWNSWLKLHAAGFLGGLNGLLYDRGSDGGSWSSQKSIEPYSATFGFLLFFSGINSEMTRTSKAQGFSLRCLKDNCLSYSTVNVSIIASSNPACEGASVVFTATPANGGTPPSYQWKKGGTEISGATNATYAYVPSNGDAIACVLTSNLVCVINNPQTSNTIVMMVRQNPEISFTPCMDTKTTADAQPYQLKGGLPLGGSYSGPGVNSITGMFDPALAGAGIKTLTYAYTNVYSCSNSLTFLIHVYTSVVFICGNSLLDIRDGQFYPTFILPNGKCWMAANLNYGTSIPGTLIQSDNCLPEKYCWQNNSLNCSVYGGMYQWDELMHYQSAERVQGLCPPGWHIPTSLEWEELVNFYNGNSLAGSPLKDLLLQNGFNGLPGGMYYLNNTWSFGTGSFNGSMYWTSTLFSPTQGVARALNQLSPSVSSYYSSRVNAFNLRCLKD